VFRSTAIFSVHLGLMRSCTVKTCTSGSWSNVKANSTLSRSLGSILGWGLFFIGCIGRRFGRFCMRFLMKLCISSRFGTSFRMALVIS